MEKIENFENNWNFIEGEQYLIKAVVRDKDLNRVYFEKFNVLFGILKKYGRVLIKGNDFMVFKPSKIIKRENLEASIDFNEC